ncbi:hypothetical protein TPENAI_60763 [Tenacibaculum litopenaei]
MSFTQTTSKPLYQLQEGDRFVKQKLGLPTLIVYEVLLINEQKEHVYCVNTITCQLHLVNKFQLVFKLS